MAVNEKPIFATELTSAAGSRLPIQPGQRIDGRIPDYAVRNMLERGLATDSAQRAKQAESQESDRRADVERQIETRSEKRGRSRRDED